MKKLTALFLCVILLIPLGCGQKTLVEGEKAPDFIVTDLQGNQVSFHQILQNKDVVLNFWATWCPYCRDEIPSLNEIFKKHKDKVAIVGISLSESSETVSSFIKSKGLEYKILLDQKGETSKLYNITGIPKNVLIGKDGTIKKLNMNVQEMDSYFSKK